MEKVGDDLELYAFSIFSSDKHLPYNFDEYFK